jgi:N-acyl-D-glutamate deacylase
MMGEAIGRRELLAMAGGATAAMPAIAQGTARKPRRLPNRAGPYDLVITGGLVVDPETGLHAIRNVGIKGGAIAAIAEGPLRGAVSLDATGQVVAPGFIDIHAHGQQLPAAWMQAFDGVTTALELESGMLPISKFYADVAREGRPINYGASVSWVSARVAVKEGLEPDGTLTFLQRAFALHGWQNSLASHAELEAILARVKTGLDEGGLGIGINAGYAPGFGRQEYLRLAELAAATQVPTFTHARYYSVKEPNGGFEAIEEIIALAAITGAHMHLCHLNSTSGRNITQIARAVKAAQARGIPITVEAYPYGAGSTAVGAESFRGPDWLERWGARDASALHRNGQPLTQAKIDELQLAEPGAVVVMHFLEPDRDAADQALLDLSVLYPGGAIASDAMPWLRGNRLVEGTVWPIPDDAFAHPRSAGCFARFVGRYVRERKAISLLEAMRKTSLIPAQILGPSVPQMRRKGRLMVGMDADVVVFDLDHIADRATFVDNARPSAGMRHVLVNGQPIIRDGARLADARPGRAIRRAAK